MSTWLMNNFFKLTVKRSQIHWNKALSESLSIKGAQSLLLRELEAKETERREVFELEAKEMLETDILQRALIRAESRVNKNVMELAEYYKIVDKVDTLKKLRISDLRDKLHDPKMYEWMKYKVAADIGGTAEREAFQMFEKLEINEKGEAAFMLWRENIIKDPQARFLQTTL